MASKTKKLLKFVGRKPELKNPIATDMFLPNHSGIASHPEAKGTFLLKAGDTMTGPLLMAGTNRINFRDTEVYLYSGADGFLYLNADGGFRINTHTLVAPGYNWVIADFNVAGFVKNSAFGTLSGGNSIDISSDTNLAVTSPIVLTDDTLSWDFSTNNTWTGEQTFEEDLHLIDDKPICFGTPPLCKASMRYKTGLGDEVLLFEGANFRFAGSNALEFRSSGAKVYSLAAPAQPGQLKFEVGGLSAKIIWGTNVVEFMSATTSGIIINDGGNAGIDLRMESLNNTHMFFLDAGLDRVGVGKIPTCTFDVAGAIASATSTFSTVGPTDDVDVSGINTLFVDNSSNAVTIGGFAGGVNGQVLHIALINAGANNVILEHNEGGATQPILLHRGADETLLSEYGGWILVCHGGVDWHDVSHARHV